MSFHQIRRQVRYVSSALVLLVTVSCTGSAAPPAGSAGPAAPASPSAQDEAALDQGAPLTALPPCGTPPPAPPTPVVPGIELPEGAIITAVQPGSPLVTVQGYIAVPPVRVRQYYQRRDDLRIFEIEDEIYEAEALVGNGTHRTYIKAQAVCAEGSRLIAVVGPEGSAAAVPAPPG